MFAFHIKGILLAARKRGQLELTNLVIDTDGEDQPCVMIIFGVHIALEAAQLLMSAFFLLRLLLFKMIRSRGMDIIT